MNLIEAWKTNRNCKWRNCAETRDFEAYDSIKKLIDTMSKDQVLADDWEIVKEKKTVVVEDVSWLIIEDRFIPYASGNNTPRLQEEYKIPAETKMKMTLEWDK